jgi:murein DD-endopeptidase MepM/ murein hydrolase activator NlpD
VTRLTQGAALALLLLAVAAPLAPPVCAQGVQLPPSIEFRVPKPPTLARGADGAFLAWELHITNLTAAATTLRRVEVLDGAAVIAVLEGAELPRDIGRPGVGLPAGGRAHLGAGLRAVVYLWIPVDETAAPGALQHRLTFQPDTTRADTVVLQGAAIPVYPAHAAMGAPLEGEWVAINGPSNASGHRRLVMALNGNLASGQRFGADFLQVNEAGSSFSGERTLNENYVAYGKPVLAVADGVVVETKDGIPDNVPGGRAVPINLETVGGNYLLIELGPGRYAFYAHLVPGSLRVSAGDRVRRGQVIGLVGNSGNSTEPHLHFHVVDGVAAGTTTLGAEGIPYALEQFDLLGRCAGLGAGCQRTGRVTLRGAIPLQNQIVEFPRGLAPEPARPLPGSSTLFHPRRRPSRPARWEPRRRPTPKWSGLRRAAPPRRRRRRALPRRTEPR